MRVLLFAAIAIIAIVGNSGAHAAGYREIFSVINQTIGVLQDLDRLGASNRSPRDRRNIDAYGYGATQPYGYGVPRYERAKPMFRQRLPQPYLMEAEGLIVLVKPTPYGYADILDPDTGEHLGTMALR